MSNRTLKLLFIFSTIGAFFILIWILSVFDYYWAVLVFAFFETLSFFGSWGGLITPFAFLVIGYWHYQRQVGMEKAKEERRVLLSFTVFPALCIFAIVFLINLVLAPPGLMTQEKLKTTVLENEVAILKSSLEEKRQNEWLIEELNRSLAMGEILRAKKIVQGTDSDVDDLSNEFRRWKNDLFVFIRDNLSLAEGIYVLAESEEYKVTRIRIRNTGEFMSEERSSLHSELSLSMRRLVEIIRSLTAEQN